MNILKPTKPRDLIFLASLCACAALWATLDLFLWNQLNHSSGFWTKVSPDSFPGAAVFLSSYGLEGSSVPTWVIYFLIVLRIIFWIVSSIILAKYNFNSSARTLGLLLCGMIVLDIVIKASGTGNFQMSLINSFGSIKAAFQSLFVLAITVWLLIPRPKGNHQYD